MPRDREWDNLRSRVSKFLKIRYSDKTECIISLFKEFYAKFCQSIDSSCNDNYKTKIIEYVMICILGPLKSTSKQMTTSIYLQIVKYCKINGVVVQLPLNDITCKYKSNQKRGFASARTGYTTKKRKENKQIYNFKSARPKIANTFLGPIHRKIFTIQLSSKDPKTYENLFNKLKQASCSSYYNQLLE